jgi:hypothetical protein
MIRPLAALLVGWMTCGCTAPELCRGGDNRSSVDAGPLSETVTFDDVGFASRHFVATIQDLPRVWDAEAAVVESSIGLGVDVVYQDEPKGGDGKTQMPAVEVELSVLGAFEPFVVVTDSFHTVGTVSGHAEAFRICDDADDVDCCVFGSTECRAPITVSVRRREGAPFPPVDVSLSLTASATVTPCPLEEDVKARLTLEAE